MKFIYISLKRIAPSLHKWYKLAQRRVYVYVYSNSKPLSVFFYCIFIFIFSDTLYIVICSLNVLCVCYFHCMTFFLCRIVFLVLVLFFFYTLSKLLYGYSNERNYTNRLSAVVITRKFASLGIEMILFFGLLLIKIDTTNC